MSTDTSTDQAENTAQPIAEPIDAVIAYSRAAEQVGLWIAKDEGFFEENGLNITLQETNTSAQVPVAISGGSAQMGYETGPDFLTANAKGVPLVVVSGLSVDTVANARVAVFASAESGIKSVADLAGKRIAVPGVGTSTQVSTANLVDKAGADYSSIRWIPLPFQDHADALKSGRVDAAVSVYPFIGQLRAAGYTEVVGQFASSDDEKQIVVLLSGGADWVAENPGAPAAVRKSLDAATEFAKSNPDETKKIIEKYSGLGSEIVDRIPPPNLDTVVTPDQLKFFNDMLVRQGIIDTDLDVASLIAE